MEIQSISIELLYKKLDGRLSAEEEAEVQKWLEVPAHRTYFERLEQYYRLSEEAGTSDEELDEAWGLMQKRMKSRSGFVIKRILWGMTAIAASVVLVWTSLLFLNDRVENPEYAVKEVQIYPGQRNAILELANGRIYDLGKLARQENLKIADHIVMDSCLLNYTQLESGISDSLSFNTLTVPRGGEFQILLEDGTKVWLNSDTRLRYPEVFSGKSREVYLEGEAYFEVTKDPEHPFIVYSGLQKITVLGTSFGITGYPDESGLSATLVTGKVKVEYPQVTDRQYLLEPGSRIFYDSETETISQKQVDVREYVAWKDGKYVFNRKRLEDMLITLSRWYDFQVLYQNPEMKEMLFSGELMRFENFNDILSLIEKSADVKFTISGRLVSVSK